MEANLVMALVVFGILFLTLAAGIWVGFSLFIVGFMGMLIFSPLPAGSNMASSVWAAICGWSTPSATMTLTGSPSIRPLAPAITS